MEGTTKTSLKELLAQPVTALVNLEEQVVVSLPFDATVAEALQLLREKQLLSVPVKAENNGYLGFFDVLHVAAHLDSVCKDLNSIDSHKFFKRRVRDLLERSGRECFGKVTATTTVGQLLEKFVAGLHRVALMDGDEISKVITQSDVMRFLEAKGNLSSVTQQSVKDLGLVKEWVLFINTNDRALNAFKKMVQHSVSAMAVADVEKTLMGNLVASDLRFLTNDKEFHDITLPIMSFLHKYKGEGEPVLACKEDDLLGDVLAHVIHHHYHRLWVVDNKRQPIGVVTLTDICQAVHRASLEE
ncbi:hypothetical protein QOT17_002179 [Balamuthia mandrillaris]